MCWWSVPVFIRVLAPRVLWIVLPYIRCVIQSIIHHPFILSLYHCLTLMSLCLLPTGPGGNPNSGSGFQSGVWILAGCQGRYAWSPPTTRGVWRMSENVPLFAVAILSACIHPLPSFLVAKQWSCLSLSAWKFTFSCVFLVTALTPSRGALFDCSCHSLLSFTDPRTFTHTHIQ